MSERKSGKNIQKFGLKTGGKPRRATAINIQEIYEKDSKLTNYAVAESSHMWKGGWLSYWTTLSLPEDLHKRKDNDKEPR